MTTLAQAAELPRGTRVATVTLTGADGATARWELRTGSETAEWSAARPDPARRVAAAPVAWAWAAPGATFLARAYRASWRPATALRRPLGLDVARDPALPADVELTLLRLQVSP